MNEYGFCQGVCGAFVFIRLQTRLHPLWIEDLVFTGLLFVAVTLLFDDVTDHALV